MTFTKHRTEDRLALAVTAADMATTDSLLALHDTPDSPHKEHMSGGMTPADEQMRGQRRRDETEQARQRGPSQDIPLSDHTFRSFARGVESGEKMRIRYIGDKGKTYTAEGTVTESRGGHGFKMDFDESDEPETRRGREGVTVAPGHMNVVEIERLDPFIPPGLFPGVRSRSRKSSGPARFTVEGHQIGGEWPGLQKHRDAQGSTEHHRKGHTQYDQRHALEHPEETAREQGAQATGRERSAPRGVGERPTFSFQRPEQKQTPPTGMTPPTTSISPTAGVTLPSSVTRATVETAKALVALHQDAKGSTAHHRRRVAHSGRRYADFPRRLDLPQDKPPAPQGGWWKELRRPKRR